MRTTPAGGAAPRGRDFSGLGAPIALAVFLGSQYRVVWSTPFINDDYIFLDKTRAASFFSLWAPRALAFHWYRPWSRELHYWTLQRLFGPHELPFHVVSFALALAILCAAHALFRRLAEPATAAIAVAGVAALAAWGVPLVWIAGVQDLWMMWFALLFLLAVGRESQPLAAAALILALLSKEAAAMLPALAVAERSLVGGRSWRRALAWCAPLFAIDLAWAAFHPVLGGRWWHPINDPLEPGLHSSFASTLGRTLGVPFNLDARLAPEHGWPAAAVAAALGIVALAGLVALGARSARRGRVAPRRLMLFGLAWAALAWLPLLLPTLGWHAYYALFGAFGAWLALSVRLARWPALAILPIAALVVLRAASADTPSRDWGSEWYQRRAGEFIAFMRADLARVAPQPSPHSRFYFVRVPSNVGFLAGDGPALRVWYQDSTLRGGYYPSFRARTGREPTGPDRFFRFDSTAGWIPVAAGAENVAAARRANPRWILDHDVLAGTLAQGGAWAAAATEYEKLAVADSSSVDFAYNAGVSWETLGDSARAASWYARAAARPGADAEVRAQASHFAARHPGPARR